MEDPRNLLGPAPHDGDGRGRQSAIRRYRKGRRPRRSLSAAFLVYAGGAADLLLAGTTTPYGYELPALLAIGFASGFISPVATAPALGTVNKEQVGIAAGMLNAARQDRIVMRKSPGLF